MQAKHTLRFAGRTIAGGAALALASYAAYVAFAWARYGRNKPSTADERDSLLDEFMPVYEVVERHSIQVGAPADATLSSACDTDLEESGLVKVIFRTRELVLGSRPVRSERPRGLLAFTKSLG